MSDTKRTDKNLRKMTERVIISGDLTLLTPASLGNGDSDGLLDMPLARDAAEGVPLLTGSSIAGALRNYLRLREQGYRQREKEADGIAERLFGGLRSKDEGAQSSLIVDDAWATQTPTEIRDGVRIDPQTRTAQDKKKFDLELLPSGTTFKLRFELVITEEHDREALLKALALALSGFEQQDIALGARKRRGFGQCVVEQWEVTTYKLNENEGVLSWLASGLNDTAENGWNFQPVETRTGKATHALNIPLPDADARQRFTINAHFALASPLLIRSEEPIPVEHGAEYPDHTHLRSQRPENAQTPVLPGTSLAGVLRGRAQRILNTLALAQPATQGVQEQMLDSIFGSDMDRRPADKYASRLVVKESVIENDAANWLVQQRVGIDRFTGGAYDTALFSEAPLTGGQVTLQLMLEGNPKGGTYSAYQTNDESRAHHPEVGLLLLLLKDLWTGDLPLGGTSSIGRGRLRGISATLADTLSDPPCSWQLDTEQAGNIRISGNSSEQLEAYVVALHTALGLQHEEAMH
jgi:CRISPR/Cas system CSM-associated protein Csm3 (group 7 of RAMP superfamily)